MRKLVASAAVVAALAIATLAAFVVARSLWPQPVPEPPHPTRVVNVDVQS